MSDIGIRLFYTRPHKRDFRTSSIAIVAYNRCDPRFLHLKSQSRLFLLLRFFVAVRHGIVVIFTTYPRFLQSKLQTLNMGLWFNNSMYYVVGYFWHISVMSLQFHRHGDAVTTHNVL